MKADEVKWYKSDEVISIVDGRFVRPDIVIYSDFLAYAKEAEEVGHAMDRAYSMLEANGVSRERAKSVANGIDVLSTRYRRELNTVNHAYDALQSRLDEAVRVIERLRLFTSPDCYEGLDLIIEKALIEVNKSADDAISKAKAGGGG